MILMIDNYDSFTYNIVHYCLELGAKLKIIKNDELSIKKIKKLKPKKIIISPGPSKPKNAGICLKLIKEFQDLCPILGICLGHQSIAEVFGAKVVKASNMMHGKTSKINIIKKDKLFKNIKKNFIATRYHSLVIDKNTINKNIIISSLSADDNEIMSIKIKDKEIYGIQFHPESIMSEYGKEILNNFLKI